MENQNQKIQISICENKSNSQTLTPPLKVRVFLKQVICVDYNLKKSKHCYIDFCQKGKKQKIKRQIMQESENCVMFIWSENGANQTEAFVKGHSWRQNEDYVGGATC